MPNNKALLTKLQKHLSRSKVDTEESNDESNEDSNEESNVVKTKCFNCLCNNHVENRSFLWRYRPRNKDKARGVQGNENDCFNIDLCFNCFNIVEGTILYGWDVINN